MIRGQELQAPGPWSLSLACSRLPVGAARALPWPASKEDLGKPAGASSTGAFMQPPAMITQTLAHHPFTRSLVKAGPALLVVRLWNVLQMHPLSQPPSVRAAAVRAWAR